jgi:hypothetical protein
MSDALDLERKATEMAVAAARFAAAERKVHSAAKKVRPPGPRGGVRRGACSLGARAALENRSERERRGRRLARLEPGRKRGIGGPGRGRAALLSKCAVALSAQGPALPPPPPLLLVAGRRH